MESTLDSEIEDQIQIREVVEVPEVPAQNRIETLPDTPHQETARPEAVPEAALQPEAAPEEEPEPQHAADNASSSLTATLAQVGPRLRQLRQDRGGTLAGLARATGISVSTLSRLESGQRRPSLELLLPIARAYQVPIDELVAEVEVDDPRVALPPTRRGGLTIQPLTRRPGGLQAYRMTVPPSLTTPQLQTHEGYEWLYVLGGRLRLVLADKDLVLEPGEAAEFDTRLPHWFGSTGEGPVEFLSLFGSQGERYHLRPHSRRDHEN